MDVDTIFEAAGKATEILHGIAEVKGLLGEATKIIKCGDCDFWMKSSLCPQEKNVKGYSRGPSVEGFPCNNFTWEKASLDWRKERLCKAKKHKCSKYLKDTINNIRIPRKEEK